MPTYHDLDLRIHPRYRYLPIIQYPAAVMHVNRPDPMEERCLKFWIVRRLLVAQYNLDHKQRHERAADIGRLKYIPCVGECGLTHANYVDPSRKHVSEWCCVECHRRICGFSGEQRHPYQCKLRDGENPLL